MLSARVISVRPARSWSFSAAADIEGTHFLATGDLVELSNQQLVECSTANDGCGGGWPMTAMQYVQHAGGVAPLANMTYKMVNMEKSQVTPTCDKAAVNAQIQDESAAAITGWQVVAMSADDEDRMATGLLRNGPLAAAFNSHGMDFYVNGIAGGMSDSDVASASDQTARAACDPEYIDHAVLIVGYGTQDDVDYWTVKNSWGTEWGESGYYRMVRGSNHCGIANFVVHSVVKKPN